VTPVSNYLIGRDFKEQQSSASETVLAFDQNPADLPEPMMRIFDDEGPQRLGDNNE
jgi:hypothetical protein